MGQAPLGHPPFGSWIHPAQVSTWHLFRLPCCSLLTPSSPPRIWDIVPLKPFHSPGDGTTYLAGTNLHYNRSLSFSYVKVGSDNYRLRLRLLRNLVSAMLSVTCTSLKTIVYIWHKWNGYLHILNTNYRICAYLELVVWGTWAFKDRSYANHIWRATVWSLILILNPWKYSM
jgi:hypothetical protein